MNFIEKLDFLMKRDGIKNKKQLAEKSNIPYTTIVGFYEKGTDNIRRTTLLKLAKCFECSLDYLANDDVIDPIYGRVEQTQIKKRTENFSDENKLLNAYRSLSEEGQEKLIDYADDLIRSGKYKKCNSSDMVEKQA
ncbi:MAG: helix-turn-helix transcriptional regulator [Clostridiales bacterium]